MIELPEWAVQTFVALFFAVLAIAGFGIRYFGSRIHRDLESVKVGLQDVDRRLIRVEVMINGRNTPPTGVPAIRSITEG